MGFLACGFTSSNHNLCVGILFLILEGWTTLFALIAYMYFLIFAVAKDISLIFQYISSITALVHLCASLFLFVTDLIFKSDTMFIMGQTDASSGSTTVTNFGSMSTNPQIQVEEDDDGHCLKYFNTNPWTLYRKHYIIMAIKITCLVLDIVILIMFRDSWKCAYTKC